MRGVVVGVGAVVDAAGAEAFVSLVGTLCTF